MDSTVGSLILRGLVVGVVAGLLAFGWARVFGEPPVNTSIAFESSEHAAADKAAVASGHTHGEEEPEIFSRSVQSGIGLLTGIVAIGAGLGGLFAVLFAFANGRLGMLGPRATAALLAFFAWASIFLVPALKYPPNPPAIGEPDTIQIRTAMYFLVMVISIAASVGSILLQRRLSRRHGTWTGSLWALGAYVIVIGTCFLLFPDFHEAPVGFPAETLWDFRIASIGIQTVLWAGIGLLFGYLAEGVVAAPAHAPART